MGEQPKKTLFIFVRRISDGKVVHKVDVTYHPSQDYEIVIRNLMRDMDKEKYIIDDSMVYH